MSGLGRASSPSRRDKALCELVLPAEDSVCAAAVPLLHCDESRPRSAVACGSALTPFHRTLKALMDGSTNGPAPFLHALGKMVGPNWL